VPNVIPLFIGDCSQHGGRLASKTGIINLLQGTKQRRIAPKEIYENKKHKINATMHWVGHALGGDERHRAEGLGRCRTLCAPEPTADRQRQALVLWQGAPPGIFSEWVDLQWFTRSCRSQPEPLCCFLFERWCWCSCWQHTSRLPGCCRSCPRAPADRTLHCEPSLVCSSEWVSLSEECGFTSEGSVR